MNALPHLEHDPGSSSLLAMERSSAGARVLCWAGWGQLPWHREHRRLAASASHGASPFRECWGSPGRALQGSTGQCQTRSGWELMAKRVIPACLQLHLPPRASAAGKTQRSNAGRICSPGCRDFPPTGDHHLASSIPRAGPRRAEWGPAPSGATVHMCHRLDTRGNRLETSGPAARASSSVDRGTGRYLVLLGLPSRLSGTQRGSGAHKQDSG